MSRSATAIRFKPDVHQRLKVAAEERDLSINWLVNKAVEQFLDRLIPIEELTLTRPAPSSDQTTEGDKP